MDTGNRLFLIIKYSKMFNDLSREQISKILIEFVIAIIKNKQELNKKEEEEHIKDMDEFLNKLIEGVKE